MTNQLGYLYLSLKDLADPLLKRLASVEALEFLFHRYGWIINLTDPVYTRLNQVLAVRTALNQFFEAASLVQKKLDENPDQDVSSSDIAMLAQKALPLISALAGLKPSQLTDLPEPLNQTAFWSDIAEHLLDDLLEEYIRIYQPPAYAVLHLLGVIRYQDVNPAGAHRMPYVRTRIDWDQAVEVVKNPAAAIQQTYGWGVANKAFDHQLLLESLQRALRAIQVSAKLVPPGSRVSTIPASSGIVAQKDVDALRIPFLHQLSGLDRKTYEVGIDLAPAAKTGQPKASGLIVKPALAGGAEQTLPLGRDFALKYSAAADIGDSLVLGLFPDQVKFASGQASAKAAVAIASTRTTPWYLLGNPRTARIEVNGISAGLSMEGTAADPETKVQIKTGGPNGQPGCKVVIPLGESDGFVKDTVSDKDIEFTCSPEMIWSSKTGLTFNGRPGLDIDIPLDRKIGAVTLRNGRIAITEGPKKGNSPSLLARVDLGVEAKLGPVTLVIDRMGMACAITSYKRQDLLSLPPGAEPPAVGNFDVDLRFAPPQGVGITIDASAVTGGGYLFYDPAKEEYAGVLQLQIGNIQLSAIGLLTTRMPDGSKGFSLIVSITAQGFQPIQLGFGFRLSGIGGLLGVNRTVAVDVLRSGLRDNTLDAILFPEDPVRNAGEMVSNIRRIFPPAKGRFVFGPMVAIDWGTPPILTMELAVLLELPSPVRLIVLGQLRAILPKKELPLVRLNMDVLGVLEIDKGELAIDAVLHDSQILGFAITGDMALRARWLTNPALIMSAGGLNPRFKPPEGFPKLNRLAINLANGDNPRLRLEAYLALTSNTAQVGARLDLRVTAAGFTLEGYLYFDALFQFSPFQFVADMGAGVALKWQGRTLLSVQLELTLSGPSQWRAKGKATFKIWVFSKSVNFDKTFGPQQAPPVLPPADPLPELMAALRDVRSWSGAAPDRSRALVSVREAPSNGDLWVHPLGVLGVRQKIVPLDIEISKFGNTAPAGERRFRITHVRLGNQTLTNTQPLSDYFAPGQFQELTEAQSLSRPSFEQLTSGVEIAGGALAFGGQSNAGLMALADAVYETVTHSPSGTFNKPKAKAAMAKTVLLGATEVGLASRAAARRGGSAKYTGLKRDVSPRDQAYAVARTTDLKAAPEAVGINPAKGTSYTAAAQALAKAVATNKSLQGRVKVVARQELTEVGS